MKQNNKKQSLIWQRTATISFAAILFLSAACPSSAMPPQPSQEKFFAIPLVSHGKRTYVLEHDGVPFAEGTLRFDSNGAVNIPVGGAAKRIFLLGMAESAHISCWADPLDESVRFFIGDDLGQIRLNYVNGTTQTFPLIFGESVWFGEPFALYPEPFPTDARLRKAFADALNLYPPAPVAEGKYVAFIAPKPTPIQSITIENSPAKRGTLILDGMTIEPADAAGFAGAIPLAPGNFPPAFEKFIRKKSLRPLGENEGQSERHLNELRLALYSSDKTFLRGHVVPETPHDYSGPQVSFAGSLYAKILANAFLANVQDISDKIDADGMYHTSTKGAISWNGAGFGTFRTNVGIYYNASWCRDMGRSLQEITALGYTNDALRCADYCLRMEKLWEQPANKYHGQFLPPHWGRIANRPAAAPPFESDGQGLVTMFLYKLWQRLPDRDEWLRARWPDIEDAGDWVLWEFAHPEISGASNGVLHTTGECAGGNGYSVYGDAACMKALQALAQMADSIGETNSAAQWRDRAEKMRQAISDNYIITDPKYGRVWTLVDSGWPTHPTVLGPLIFVADYEGFAPQDDDPAWRPVNEAAYQRLIDAYKPFGFYGQAMGYGQGFVTESALLLDRMRDATEMLNWIAKQIYDPRFGCFITPEGVQIDPTGKYWFRAGDLGNGVQEAEIVKTLRLVIGVDDTRPGRLQFYPRMPYDWNEITVKKYPVLTQASGRLEMTFLYYQLKRSRDGMKLEIGSDKALGPVEMRLGPFEKTPDASKIRVNGQSPTEVLTEHSGDSWWVRFMMPVGPTASN